MPERSNRRSTRSPAGHRVRATDDRRAEGGSGTARLLRWLKGLVKRPFRVEMRGGHVRVSVVDRRGAPSPDHPRSLTRLLKDLSRQLDEVADTHAAEVLLPLRVVHHELGRRGWPGVEALPAKVLDKAVAQAELLSESNGAGTLAPLVERLRELAGTAQAREARKAQLQERENRQRIEVSEATVEEFAEMERSWVGVIPTLNEPLAEKGR